MSRALSTGLFFLALIGTGTQAVAPAFGQDHPAAFETEVDTWFDSNESTTSFFALASLVGRDEIFERASAQRIGLWACPRTSYSETARSIDLQWKDAQVSGEQLECPETSSRPGRPAPFCVLPGRDGTRSRLWVSMGAWHSTRNDAGSVRVHYASFT